jgi:hypothetical protein
MAALQATRVGTITAQYWECPHGYDSQFFPQVCTVGTQPIRLTRPLGENDRTLISGSVLETYETVFRVPEGSYYIDVDTYGHNISRRIYECTRNGEDISRSELVPPAIDVSGGDRITCSVYFQRESFRAGWPVDELKARLVLRLRQCDRPVHRSEFHEQCFANAVGGAAVRFSASDFNREVRTDADGNYEGSFPLRTLTIEAARPAGARQWLFCSRSPHPGVPLLNPVLTSYESVTTCDLYLIPDAYLVGIGDANSPHAALELHYRQCPVGYSGQNYFGDCHTNPIADEPVTVESEASGPAVGYTDGAGIARFLVAPDRYQVPFGPLGSDSDRASISCANSSAPGQEIEYPLLLSGGDDVVCDLYLIPQT